MAGVGREDFPYVYITERLHLYPSTVWPKSNREEIFRSPGSWPLCCKQGRWHPKAHPRGYVDMGQ